MADAPKRLFIETYGCQMNVYDSERMRDVLSPLGYAVTDRPDDADLVILNTCHIREKATEKVYSEIGRLRAHKERRAGEGKSMTITIAGCVAQAEGEEIMRRAPEVDLVVGPQAYHKLPELIAKLKAEPGKASYPSSGNGTTNHLAGELFKTRTGVDILHVPYRGTGPALQDLLAGRHALMFGTLGPVMENVRAGQLVPVALITLGAQLASSAPGAIAKPGSATSPA